MTRDDGARDGFERWGSREVELTHVSLLDRSEDEHFIFHPGDPFSIKLQYSVREPVADSLVFGVGIHHLDGTLLFGTNTDIERVTLSVDGRQSGTVRCTIPQLSLLSGEYWLDVAVHREDGYPFDYWKRCIKFSVRSSVQQVGRVYLKTEWLGAVDGSSSIGGSSSFEGGQA